MAVFAWGYNDIPILRGVRTRIASGPLLHGLPVHWLVFSHPSRSPAPEGPITFSVAVYSASPPWYFTASGIGRVWRPGNAMPWNLGYPIWLAASPWIEVYVTGSVTCLAGLKAV